MIFEFCLIFFLFFSFGYSLYLERKCKKFKETIKTLEERYNYLYNHIVKKLLEDEKFKSN